MAKKFRKGGVHPPENKSTRNLPCETFPLPEVAVIPLSQHIGAPSVACVEVGQTVVVGQLIGRSGGFVSAGVHSSVSGRVTAVGDVTDIRGMRTPAVMIEVEGDTWLDTVDRSEEIVHECDLAPEEIVARVAEAGVVGMGGATFPTHVKLSPPPNTKADTLIINGAECEPYITCDHRLMVERSREIVVGATIASRALGVERTVIAVEANKPDAIEALRLAAAGRVEVAELRTRYPQGGEKQLIEAVTGRRVPSGGLPIAVGAVVQNVGTAVAVYEAVQKRKPLIERRLTVTGSGVARGGNFAVRIGTPFEKLIDHCGGLRDDQIKIISGGPMMGYATGNMQSPVTKGTTGILALSGSEARRRPETSCIKCAKCVSVCPMGLEPYLLIKLVRLGRAADAEPRAILDCIECGSCAYTCPASLPLLDFIRTGKRTVAQLKRERDAK
ncbi:MAG: electron transport complex subunit RsxC [Rikenellaceae bacterium]|jgi:electron transport complex protein RnfC|nr:electron transport complex subunit RsxC [Rikenellaceae bacterium]